MKRRDEEVSRTSFCDWFAPRQGVGPVVWHEIPQDKEPPDWHLDIDDRRFAVETTSVVEYLWDFHPPLSSYSISASLSHFVDRVRREAISQGPLNGAYLVSLAPIRNFKDHEKWLFDELISYIERTRHLPSADEYDLGKIGFQSISISKVQSDQEFVAEAVSFGAKFQGEAQDDLIRIMDSIFEKKSDLLHEIRHPVLLLLLDAWHYSEIVDWKEAISHLSIPRRFLSIFRTSLEQPAEVLFSRSIWWQSDRLHDELDA
jgi:hypothetical protein